jgi:Tripartite tricarboxylate transporter TctB family
LANASPRVTKDRAGAILLILLGAGVIIISRDYGIGSLSRMGSGFVPLTLGVLLVLVGIGIGLTATSPTTSRERAGDIDAASHGFIDWRSWLCILGGVLAFIFVGRTFGMVPGTFAVVFISALSDRGNSVRHAALLALALSVAGIIIFHFGLRIQMPLFSWGS